MKEPEDFQTDDEAAVAAMLADGALATTLAALVSWQGFYGTLADADDALTEPSDPPALPAAGAYWQLRYVRKPDAAQSHVVFRREAVVDLFLRLQPGFVTADAARAKVLAVAKAIKARLRALATAQKIVDAAYPLATLDQRRGWPEFRQLIGFNMGDT